MNFLADGCTAGEDRQNRGTVCPDTFGIPFGEHDRNNRVRVSTTKEGTVSGNQFFVRLFLA